MHRTEHPPRDRASRRGPTRCATCRSPPRQRNIRRWPRRRGIGVDDQEGASPASARRAIWDLQRGPSTLGGRTVVPGLFDAHVHYTRAGVNPGYEAGASNVRSRSPSCRRRSRRARRRSRRAPSSHASVAGTTRSLPRIDGRRSPTWTRPRRSTSTSPAPAAARVRSRTASAARSSPREGDGRRRDGRGGVGTAAVAALQAVQTSETGCAAADLNAHASSLGLTGVINAGNLAGSGIRAHAVAKGHAVGADAARVPRRLAAGGRGAGPQQLQPGGQGRRRPVPPAGSASASATIDVPCNSSPQPG